MRNPLLPPLLALLALSAGLLVAGCQTVPAYQQQHLSKPGMTFSDSLVEDSQTKLTAQIEPGSQTSGGAQASGCSACR
ncbi:hypothetical protein IEN85_12320 [Pelagicoccus sp. NFK12]|uniref:Lipoprotein n=1 Tax=Pelagicoccus enzymogenes TaxID=2773457 RepID=A0A927F8H8_9BACT|nr:hypothetical protein [Pelagicoccus enzymogenes]MBD5780279.1 hypothetical protein [Pelagicoccus enzymogenes]